MLLGISVVIAIVGGETSHQSAPATEIPPAEQAKKDAEKKAQTERATFAGVAVASLKKSLRDPASFELERAFTTVDAKIACLEYRARNGFGGMNREQVVFTAAGGDQSTSAWNKHCVGKGFSDQTANAERLAAFVD